MKKFSVKLIYTYSEQIEIEAESRDGAEALALKSEDIERNNDDSLYDIEVEEIIK